MAKLDLAPRMSCVAIVSDDELGGVLSDFARSRGMHTTVEALYR